jgi:hypothetical protein
LGCNNRNGYLISSYPDMEHVQAERGTS